MTFKKLLEEKLTEKDRNGRTRQEIIVDALIDKASNGDTKAFSTICEALAVDEEYIDLLHKQKREELKAKMRFDAMFGDM